MDSRILLCLSAWSPVLPCAALHPQENAGHLQRRALPAVQQAAAPRAVRLGIFFAASHTQPAAQKGQLISPAPGSTLAGPSVTFTWTPGSRVERFWLFVGTSLGNYNIYGADQATSTSVTVSNLPVNGQVIYVRLWSYIDGAWQFSDASYRAAGP